MKVFYIAVIGAFLLLPGFERSARSQDLKQQLQDASAGKEVAVPAGRHSEPLQIRRDLTLRGADDGKSVLDIQGTAPALTITGSEPVVVENLLIRWQLSDPIPRETSGAAILVDGGRLTLKNCQIEAAGDGAHSPCAVLAVNGGQVRLEHCRLQGYEFTVQIAGGSTGFVHDCLVRSPGHCGLTALGNAKLDVTRSMVTGSRFHGIRCTGGMLNVQDCLVIDNANRGIYLGNKSARGRVVNCVIARNGAGIGAFANSAVTIEHNLFQGCSHSAISAQETSPLVVRNNLFLNNPRGVEVAGDSGQGRLQLGRNAWWDNKVSTEGVELPHDSIEVNPQLASPEQGDFTAKAPALQEQSLGLSDPEAIQSVWRAWKPDDSEK